MNSEEQQEKFRNQRGALYAELGRFVVMFEELIDAMRHVISMHVSFGTGPQNHKYQQFANIFTAELTAYPLLKAFHSIVLVEITSYEDPAKRDDYKKIFDHIYGRIVSITQVRNDFLHGTWHLNYGSPTADDYSTAEGAKGVNAKKGLRYDALNYKVEDFLSYSDECRSLAEMVRGIGLVMLLDGFDPRTKYRFVENKLVPIV